MSKTIKGRLEHLDKYIQREWNEYYCNFIIKNENKINWSMISKNPNITFEFIEKHSDKAWDWRWISANNNITMEIFENNIDKPWNWYRISQNKFTKEKELFYQKFYRIYMATFRLQQYFNRMYNNPDYLFCRKRLERMFEKTIN